jgi:hypothetical protein
MYKVTVKILIHIFIYKRVVTFLYKKNIVFEGQNGFRVKKATNPVDYIHIYIRVVTFL